jgi:hypothetical protein
MSPLWAAFLEMAGLRLKSEQGSRVCGVDGTICQSVLDLIVDETLLCVSSDGRCARLTSVVMRISQR